MNAAELDYHIKNVNINDWKKLFDFIPLIRERKSFGEMEGLDKNPDRTLQFPYIIPEKVVEDFVDLMYELDLVVDFDRERREEERAVIATGDFHDQDAVTLIKILTTLIRSDRFNEGTLVEAFENGTIVKILTRLKNLIPEPD